MANIEYPIAGVTYPSRERAEAALASGSWIASTVGNALRKTAQAVGSALYALKAREDATLLDALVHGRIQLQALRQRAALTEPPSPGG